MSNKHKKKLNKHRPGPAVVPPPFPSQLKQETEENSVPEFHKDEEVRQAKEAAEHIITDAVVKEEAELSLFTADTSANKEVAPQEPSISVEEDNAVEEKPAEPAKADPVPLKETAPAAALEKHKEPEKAEPAPLKQSETVKPAAKQEEPVKPVRQKAETPRRVKPATVNAKPEKAPRYKTGKVLVALFVVALIFGFAGGFGGFMWFEKMIREVPPLDVGKEKEYSQASTLLDANGNFIAEYGTNENVEWVNTEEIPQRLRDAFIAIEDERFYTAGEKELLKCLLSYVKENKQHFR